MIRSLALVALALAQPLGAILIILAIWLYACDRGNEFVPWVGLAGMVLLGVGILSTDWV